MVEDTVERFKRFKSLKHSEKRKLRENLSDLGKAACAYAVKGWEVVPAFPMGKIPCVEGGFNSGTKDIDVITYWWTLHPDSNVLIVTGETSGGLVVIDVDDKPWDGKFGKDVVYEYELSNGKLPETAEVQTASGGRHLYFRSDDAFSSNANPAINIDRRANGGCVVAPPSRVVVHHPDGDYEDEYIWDLDYDDYGIAEIGEEVASFISWCDSMMPERLLKSGGKFKMPKEVHDGEGRHAMLVSQAFSFRAAGMELKELTDALEEANSKHIVPPKKYGEIKAIARSVCNRTKPGWSEEAKEAKRLADERKSIAAEVVPTLELGPRGNPKQTIANCLEVIEHDSLIRGRLIYDDFLFERMVILPLPWDDGSGKRKIRYSDYIELSAFMEKNYGLTGYGTAEKAAIAACSRASEDSLTSWIDSLKWDGTARMGFALSAMLGCEYSEYTAEVSALIFRAMVARAYDPGCKFDYMVVLVGVQGVGKSTFVRLLPCNDMWYLDDIKTFKGTDPIELIRGKWVAEVAEMSALKGSGMSAVKAFITVRNDIYRPPYGRETENRRRRVVMIGTTNNEQFLSDITGNRRFLPVKVMTDPDLVTVSVFDEDSARSFIVQCLAEAAEEYRNEATRPKLVLEGEAADMAAAKQEDATYDDPRVGLIQEYLDNRCNLTVNVPGYVCAIEIASNALNIDASRISENERQSLFKDIHAIMRGKISGWEYVDQQRCGEYGRQKAYKKSV